MNQGSAALTFDEVRAVMEAPMTFPAASLTGDMA
jgi:hypothetical protein